MAQKRMFDDDDDDENDTCDNDTPMPFTARHIYTHLWSIFFKKIGSRFTTISNFETNLHSDMHEHYDLPVYTCAHRSEPYSVRLRS
jgi:hypothetical protein